MKGSQFTLPLAPLFEQDVAPFQLPPSPLLVPLDPLHVDAKETGKWYQHWKVIFF